MCTHKSYSGLDQKQMQLAHARIAMDYFQGVTVFEKFHSCTERFTIKVHLRFFYTISTRDI